MHRSLKVEQKPFKSVDVWTLVLLVFYISLMYICKYILNDCPVVRQAFVSRILLSNIINPLQLS